MSATNRHTLNRIVLVSLLSGFVLIFFSRWMTIQFGLREPSVPFTIFSIVEHLGEAVLIAGLIAWSFEKLLSEERVREIEDIFKLHQQLERFGFRATYANRQEVFDAILSEELVKTPSELKIMGICVSLFKETERAAASDTRPDRRKLIDDLVSLIENGCVVQVLFLKRYPSPEELKSYGTQVDLYYMRERDEDKLDEFFHGKRLRKIANRSMNGWIEVLLRLAERAKDMKVDERRQVLSRLQIREYLAIPSLSLYIMDERIYVTPYLFKRHCSAVPAFQVGGKESPLYREYHSHFLATWSDQFTTPAIPQSFVDFLVEDPEAALEEFGRLRTSKQAELEEKARTHKEFSEGPDFWRAPEEAIQVLVQKMHQHSVVS